MINGHTATVNFNLLFIAAVDRHPRGKKLFKMAINRNQNRVFDMRDGETVDVFTRRILDATHTQSIIVRDQGKWYKY